MCDGPVGVGDLALPEDPEVPTLVPLFEGEPLIIVLYVELFVLGV